MLTIEQFIRLSQEVIIECKAGTLSLHSAAAKINASPFEYPFEGPAHPMMYKVADLAFQIAEAYRSEIADNTDWVLLTDTLHKFISGNWEPTCWILSAIYGEYDSGKLVLSYSAAIRRQNGETIIQTSSDKLKVAINRVVAEVNVKQTDERFLQNLILFMPDNTGTLKLASVHVEEYLTEPYSATKY